MEELSGSRLQFARFLTSGKPYVIHLNLVRDAKPSDILDSYYFARLLDLQLQNVFKKEKSFFTVEHAIQASEWQFKNEYKPKEFN